MKRIKRRYFLCFLVSEVLSIMLGKGSEMLEFLTNYFLSKVVTNLHMWASESDVIKETGENVMNVTHILLQHLFQLIYLSLYQLNENRH